MRHLILLLLLPFAAHATCHAQAGPPYVQCHVTISTRGEVTQNGGIITADVYSATASGVANGFKTVVYSIGCGFRSPVDCDQSTGEANNIDYNNAASFAINLVTYGFNGSGPLNLIVVYVPMAGAALISSNITAGDTQVVVAQQGTNWWPNVNWTGPISVIDTNGVHQENLTATSTTTSGTPWTVQVSPAFTYSHTAGGTNYVIYGNVTATTIANAYAEAIAWYGHYCGTTTAPGNCQQTYLLGLSSGTFGPQILSQLGNQIYNASNSDYTLADFNKVNIVRTLLLSPTSNLPCIAQNPPNTTIPIVPLLGGWPTVSSFTHTLGANACNTVGPNSVYTAGLTYSATGCLPGQVGCSYGTPLTTHAVPQCVVTGGSDTIVGPYNQNDWHNKAPGYIDTIGVNWQNFSTAGAWASQTVGPALYAALGHDLDIYSPGDGTDWKVNSPGSTAWTPNPAVASGLYCLLPAPSGSVSTSSSSGAQ